MVRCPNCGEENPERFRLCGFCGTSLVATAPTHEVRKTVTVVFSDLQGSTALGERLDSESLREVLNVYFREMQAVLERHGGTVEKFIGDAIMAVFGLPRLHEDDALRAVRAAWQMRAALTVVNADLEARWGVRLTNRTGVNTGEVVSGEVTTGQRLVTGDVVNTAARLEQAAPANEVLLGETTWRLVRDAVEVEAVEPLTLKGKAETVPAYKLLGASGEEGIARRADTPMVGRRAELAALNAALAEATAAGRPRLVTVFAPAGVGKSRLLEEFVRGADGVPILRSRCLPYGEGITFWPLAEMIRQAAGITDEDPTEAARERIRAMFAADGRVAERLETAIGLTPGAFTVEETFWAARRLIETVAAGRPLIVIVNDLHWAEKTFLDLIAHLADTIEAPVVIVGSARPELLEDHPDWDGGDAAPERRVTLHPLSATESGAGHHAPAGRCRDRRRDPGAHHPGRRRQPALRRTDALDAHR